MSDLIRLPEHEARRALRVAAVLRSEYIVNVYADRPEKWAGWRLLPVKPVPLTTPKLSWRLRDGMFGLMPLEDFGIWVSLGGRPPLPGDIWGWSI